MKNEPKIPFDACTQRKNCAACGSTVLREVLHLPKFPLTGIFVKPNDMNAYPVFDQALLLCVECGHGQLLNTVDPKYLYQETYTHRSSASSIATSGNDFFYHFVKGIIGDRRFRCVVELGCNDLYLLNKLALHADFLNGFDPIWKGRPAPVFETIRVEGKYLEEIVPRDDFPEPPDLVVSVHTLEHVNRPLAGLQPVFEASREGALFVVEVPCLDSLVTSSRFDQVFHQHLNYFSLSSLLRMVRELGGIYVSHRFNYGYWFGTLLLAFRKESSESQASSNQGSTMMRAATDVLPAFELFRSQLQSFAGIVEQLRRRRVRVFGYGAAQMVPVLAYHMESDLGLLESVLDDDRDREGLMYPGLKPLIRLPDEIADLGDSAIAVLALDSARPILKRLFEFGPRYILCPLHVA